MSNMRRYSGLSTGLNKESESEESLELGGLSLPRLVSSL